MKRSHVFHLLGLQREAQEATWWAIHDQPHDIGAWLSLMAVYLSKAQAAYADIPCDRVALAEIRKLTALGVACLEQHYFDPGHKCGSHGEG